MREFCAGVTVGGLVIAVVAVLSGEAATSSRERVVSVSAPSPTRVFIATERRVYLCEVDGALNVEAPRPGAEAREWACTVVRFY